MDSGLFYPPPPAQP